MRIKMTSVCVHDPIEAFQFYTKILGFQELMYMPKALLAIVVSPEDADGAALLLEPNSNPASKTFQQAIYDQGLPVITFGTPDVQKEYERLSGLGVKFKKLPTTSEWGTDAVFDDGFGNYIQIHQDSTP